MATSTFTQLLSSGRRRGPLFSTCTLEITGWLGSSCLLQINFPLEKKIPQKDNDLLTSRPVTYCVTSVAQISQPYRCSMETPCNDAENLGNILVGQTAP